MMPDNKTIVWLFDPRFDGILSQFIEHIARKSSGQVKVLTMRDLAPETFDLEGRLELQQLNPEEVNRIFLQKWDADALSFGKTFVRVAAFTMVGLEPRSGLAPFGVSSSMAWHLNDKGWQFRYLEDAGLPLPPYEISDSFADLSYKIKILLFKHGAVVVQPVHSAGGEFAKLIRHMDDFIDYAQSFNDGVNQIVDKRFLVTRYLAGSVSVSGHGLATRLGTVIVLGVNELLLDEFRFDGFVYPTFLDSMSEQRIQELTHRAGEVLTAKGYWGYFAVDFLVGPTGVVINEINVRFAGETAFLAPFLRHNIFDLLDDIEAPGAQPLLTTPQERMIITKIRPTKNQIVAEHENLADFDKFSSGAARCFRTVYYDAPLRIIRGHFIGSAGAWFPFCSKREEIMRYYIDHRRSLTP